jgi:hypothetical protein
VDRTNLVQGVTKSCGCLNAELASARRKTHGQSLRTREYNAWVNMKGRCGNPAYTRYANWGGRGIQVCERWLHNFEAFFVDMGPCPPGHSLDRVNVDGHYEKSNCRWATASEQVKNRRPKVRTQEPLRADQFQTDR